MKAKEIVKYFGTETKAAASIGVTQQTVVKWVRENSIPINTQRAIAWVTNGELKPENEK